MAGSMQADTGGGRPTLSVSREPVGPRNADSGRLEGDQALMDAIAIVLLAWAILFWLVWSLRRHNI